MRKVIEYMVVAVVLLFSMFIPAYAEDDYMKWTKADIAAEVLYEVLSIVDYGQTMWVVKNPITVETITHKTQYGTDVEFKFRKNYEKNPILGKHPHQDKVRIYFLANAILHPVLVHYTPAIVKALGGSDTVAKYSRSVAQAFSIGVEAYAVSGNVITYGGIKLEW